MLQDNNVPVDIKFSGLHIHYICLKFYILKEMLICKCCVICYTFLFFQLFVLVFILCLFLFLSIV
jgi:hypothetical protein